MALSPLAGKPAPKEIPRLERDYFERRPVPDDPPQQVSFETGGLGQLQNVTIAPDGSLTPLTGLTAMVGLIGHPWEGLDLYSYAGFEQVSGASFDVGTNLFGYGNPGFSNAGCLVTTPSSFAGTTPANCIANNRRLLDVTAGFWQNVYKGDLGRLTFGAQYAYIKREAFAGIGGSPSTDDNVVMTLIRYYPF